MTSAGPAGYRRHMEEQPVAPEARCIVCDRPCIDHTWAHPVTMLDHILTRLFPW